jgi:hypothetical protein
VTAVDDRPRARVQGELRPEEFEIIAADAARDVEGLRLEFIGGKLGGKTVPDGLHSEIILWLQQRCMQHHPGMGLYVDRGLVVETYRKGRAVPDGTLAPIGHFVKAGEWAEPDGVLMTVEVASHNRDTHQRDRFDKPRAYAESGIPVHLLLDRENGEASVYCEPVGGRYREQHVVPFGTRVRLPEPVGFDLDTRQLLEWAEGAES